VRTGATEDGGARVMVYSGRSQVSAAGAEVAVEQGMGTRVPEQGPPLPPERLLAAPLPESMEQRWGYSNGRLRWAEVAGAAAYRVQVCADPDCRSLLQIAEVAGSELHLQVRPLPQGLHFWRVRALSGNGLEGYASAAARVQVDDARPDLLPPMLALQPLAGAFVGEDGVLRHATEARWLPVAQDEGSGVARIELRADGSSWTRWSGEPIEMWQVREGDLRLRAIDRLEQVSPELRLVLRDDG
jgi:hypothetical protein